VDPHLAAFIARGRAELLLGEGSAQAAVEVVAMGLKGLLDDPDPYAAVPLLALGLQATAELAEAAKAARDEGAAQRASAAGSPWQEMATGLAGRSADPVLGPLLDIAREEAARLEGTGGRDGWLTAAERFDALPDPYHAAYARFRAAEAELRAHGTRGEAQGPLASAHATARRLEAGPLRRRIEELAVRARLDPSSKSAESPESGEPLGPDSIRPSITPKAARPSGLSAREVEVLRLVAHGLSNGEIAQRLFITRKTAGVHVTHILDKLGVANRVEAAMTAARLGLAGPDDGDEAGAPGLDR